MRAAVNLFEHELFVVEWFVGQGRRRQVSFKTTETAAIFGGIGKFRLKFADDKIPFRFADSSRSHIDLLAAFCRQALS